ncbi:MAG: hypothetical protein ACOWWH_08395 [Eubacteriaceae bacterium]
MFISIMIMGMILIGIGLFKNKKNKSVNLETDNNELLQLKRRIDNIEQVYFENSLKEKTVEINSSTNMLHDYNTFASTNLLEKFEMICEYESKDYSINEISKLLNMNKGEVLLLKNLYKNYQK